MALSTEHDPRAVPDLEVRGVAIYRGWLNSDQQAAMRDELRETVRAAPFFRPVTRWGKPMSVEMTAAGKYGWISDRGGYRYARRHPGGTAFPPIPKSVLRVWRRVTGLQREPDCCLINRYAAGARLGLHQDRDEADFTWPVLSISLGDDALFRVGGTERRGRTGSVWLGSGDVAVLGGPARLAFHGVDRIRAGSSELLAAGGRLNLTLRVVD